MKSWKSASLPLCGVAVRSRKCRVRPAEKLAQAVALGVLDLAAEVGGAHLVGLVADDEVPVGLLELGLDVSFAAQLVEAADGEGVLVEPVAGPGRFELVVGHDLEGQVEPAVQLVLPLLDEVARDRR